MVKVGNTQDDDYGSDGGSVLDTWGLKPTAPILGCMCGLVGYWGILGPRQLWEAQKNPSDCTGAMILLLAQSRCSLPCPVLGIDTPDLGLPRPPTPP